MLCQNGIFLIASTAGRAGSKERALAKKHRRGGAAPGTDPHNCNSFVTSGKQFEHYKRNTKKSEFSPVQCLVACHTRTSRNYVSPAHCAFSFPFTFPDLQQMRKSGHVCVHLELCSGLSVPPDAFFWLANTKTGWASIIRPPARPASGLFQWKLGVPEDFLSSSPASTLHSKAAGNLFQE